MLNIQNNEDEYISAAINSDLKQIMGIYYQKLNTIKTSNAA